MGKNKNKNYYFPTHYEAYRNASKIKSNKKDENTEKYSYINDEYFYREIEKENLQHSNSKPVEPSLPVNAKKEPKVKETTYMPKKHSVYDEIARRRQKEQEMYLQNVNFENKFDMSLDSVAENTYEQQSENKKNDTKGYKLLKEKDSQFSEIFNSNHQKYDFSNDNYDVVEYKDNHHNKVWMTVIIVLLVLCICTGVFYAYVNGFFY